MFAVLRISRARCSTNRHPNRRAASRGTVRRNARAEAGRAVSRWHYQQASRTSSNLHSGSAPIAAGRPAISSLRENAHWRCPPVPNTCCTGRERSRLQRYPEHQSSPCEPVSVRRRLRALLAAGRIVGHCRRIRKAQSNGKSRDNGLQRRTYGLSPPSLKHNVLAGFVVCGPAPGRDPGRIRSIDDAKLDIRPGSDNA